MRRTDWPKRLTGLDVSRAFASLAVVLFHWPHLAGALAVDDDLKLRVSQPFYGVFKLFYESGHLGVQYFFLLSGFIFFWLYNESIRGRKTSVSVFWIQRFSRLYPLHFITLVMVAVLQLVYVSRVGDYFVYGHNDLYHFVLHLGFASAWGIHEGWSFNHPVWSVSIEVVLYAGFFVMAFLGLGRKYLCLLASCGAMGLSPYFSNPVFVGAAMFFFGGFILHVISEEKGSDRRALIIVSLVASISWVLVFLNVYVINFTEWLSPLDLFGLRLDRLFVQYILFSSTVAALALWEIHRGELLGRLSWMGNITYSTYLLHFPLLLTFALLYRFGWLPENFYLRPLFLVLFFLILIPASYSVYIKIERPTQNWLRAKLGRSK